MHPARDPALVSGEGVRLELSPAGVGSRTVAAAIDLVVQAIALVVIVLVTLLPAGGSDSAALGALAIAETVLVLLGYPVLMEWLTRGRTLGKMAFGLRVVRADGGPIVFGQALVRGLSSLVLEKPGLVFPLGTIAGVVTAALTTPERRIGDLLAGTLVLDERSATRPLPVPPAWVDPPLQPWAVSVDLSRVDDRLALRIRQFVARAHGMSGDAQWAIGEGLRREVAQVLAPPPPNAAPTPAVLGAVLAERRRRAAWDTHRQSVAPPAPSRDTIPWTPAPDPWTFPPGSMHSPWAEAQQHQQRPVTEQRPSDQDPPPFAPPS